MDPVMRSSIQLLRQRAAAARVDFWQILEVGLEVKVALDAVDRLPPGTPAPPVEFPDGPGYVYEVVVTRKPAIIGQGAVTAAAVPPTPPPPPPPAIDFHLDKTDKVNPIEVVAFEAWDDLLKANDPGLAHDVLTNGLRAHHYWSFLPDDPSQVTQEESDRLTSLLNVFRDLLARANERTSGGYKV